MHSLRRCAQGNLAPSEDVRFVVRSLASLSDVRLVLFLCCLVALDLQALAISLIGTTRPSRNLSARRSTSDSGLSRMGRADGRRRPICQDVLASGLEMQKSLHSKSLRQQGIFTATKHNEDPALD